MNYLYLMDSNDYPILEECWKDLKSLPFSVEVIETSSQINELHKNFILIMLDPDYDDDIYITYHKIINPTPLELLQALAIHNKCEIGLYLTGNFIDSPKEYQELHLHNCKKAIEFCLPYINRKHD